jgi:stage II sporulation protein P
MAVIGTDGNGTEFLHWEQNLAFALQLRERLNEGERGICRPVSLRNASFHQELAPCSILLEIGTAGNTVDEAKRAAKLVGDALADLIYE